MRRRFVAAGLVLLAWAGTAQAEGPSSLKGRFGHEAAMRLLGSMSLEDRLRGIERLAVQGDAQAREQLLEALERERSRSGRPEVRIALVRALAAFDDERVHEALAEVLLDERDRGSLAGLARDTAAMALARSRAPKALELLTKAAESDGLAAASANKALLARAPAKEAASLPGALPMVAFERLVERVRGADVDARREALLELGRIEHPEALGFLASMLGDVERARDAAESLALSPRKDARAHLERALAAADTRRLAAQAGILRLWVQKDAPSGLHEALRELLRSKTRSERWVGALGLSALVPEMREELLRDEDPLVVEAAALALPAHEAARRLPTFTLLALARRPFFVKALGHRDSPDLRPFLEEQLTSSDPEMRAHAASGLAHSLMPDVSARLARAYAFEADGTVRFAIVEALARRSEPQRLATLRLAARLDADAEVRELAQRALDGRPIDDLVAEAERRAFATLAFSRPSAKSPAP